MTRPSIEVDWPGVTIVVPVFNGERSLGSCITALLAQAYPASRLEIVVVNDGSTDATGDILSRHTERINVLGQTRKGPSAARNAGVKHARHEFIAFTDADCVPESSWLERLVEGAIDNPSADFIGGKIVAFRPASALERYTETLFDQEAAMRDDPPYAVSANMLVKRAFLLRLGLFDEACLRGQDTELSYRGWFNHGARFAYIESAVVGHMHCRTLGELYRKGLQHGWGAAYIRRKYARELGLTPLQGCIRIKRYRAICSNFLTSATRTLPRLSTGRGDIGSERAFPLYEAIFNLGKEIGFLRTTVKSSAPFEILRLEPDHRSRGW